MPYPVWLAIGATIGLLARSSLAGRFPLLFRTQQLVIGAPMALLSGWSLVLSVEFTATLLAVIAAEWATLLAFRRRGSLLRASACHANAGFWAMPVTASLIPSALPLAVVNGMFGMLRGAPALAMFRRASPLPQSTAAGFIDFSPAILLVSGFAAGRFAQPPIWADQVLASFANFIGAYGMFLLAAAMPDRVPSRSDWLEGAAALPVRFIGPLAFTILFSAIGIPLSPLIWILALAPVALNTLVHTRVYGLDHRVATTQLVLTGVVALAALPLVSMLVTGAAVP